MTEEHYLVYRTGALTTWKVCRIEDFNKALFASYVKRDLVFDNYFLAYGKMCRLNQGLEENPWEQNDQ